MEGGLKCPLTKSVVHTLYDRFTHPSSMQDAREGFHSAKYTASMGIQGFYDILMDYAQNMAVYPDEYTILDVFLQGIPLLIFTELLTTIGLSPEINTLEEFVVYAKEVEQPTKTEAYYRQLRVPRRDTNTTKGQDKIGTKDAPAKPHRRQQQISRHLKGTKHCSQIGDSDTKHLIRGNNSSQKTPEHQ